MYNDPLTDLSLLACPDCDLLQKLPNIAEGASARCPRCNFELWRRRDDSSRLTLPLTMAAVVLYLLANAFPMLGLSAVGHQAETTVFGGAAQLWRDGRQLVAGLVLFTVVVAPALQIGFMLLISLGALAERPRRWVGSLIRHYEVVRVWSMFEVMLLGVLVALIKIAELATVIPGLALFALGALVFLLAAIHAAFDPRSIWLHVQWAAEVTPPDPSRPPIAGATR